MPNEYDQGKYLKTDALLEFLKDQIGQQYMSSHYRETSETYLRPKASSYEFQPPDWEHCPEIIILHYGLD